jgi:S1-C subfamily serine protease
MSAARKVNLPEEWARRYESEGSRQLLSVSSVVAGAPADELLRTGDILLSINGNTVKSFRELERASQSVQAEVRILRDGEELVRNVSTVELDGFGIDRVVLWAGALLQAPHRDLAAQRGISRGGVYVAFFNFGSPASRYELFAGRRIVAVDGNPTADLDQFVAAVSGLPDRSSVRLNTLTWNNVPEVITLELDEQYWPSYQLRRTAASWNRLPLTN